MKKNNVYGISTIMKFTILSGIYLLFAFIPLVAGELPFRNLTDEDLAQLHQENSLFRILDSYKDFSLVTEDSTSSDIERILKDVKPNFLAEVLMVIPVHKEFDNLEFVRTTLMDVALFDDIPYYSERNEKWYKLFKNTEILSQTSSSPGNDTIIVSHRMKPFKTNETVYQYRVKGNTLFFESRNRSNIYYKNFKAVKEGNLITLLWVEDRGDELIIYGVGGASAFTFFGLFGDRLDNSFIGKTEAFFEWFKDKQLSKITKY